MCPELQFRFSNLNHSDPVLKYLPPKTSFGHFSCFRGTPFARIAAHDSYLGIRAKMNRVPAVTPEQTTHLIWPDVLKIAAIYAVILIHVAAPLLPSTKDLSTWWIGNFYDSLSRWCIPVFFMLSGAFLIPKVNQGSLGSFFLRRFQRVFIPFLVWSLLYYLWRMHVNNESELKLSGFLPLFLKEPIYYHLWFLYVLIELYLIAPVLGILLKSANRSYSLYFYILWVLFALLLPSIESHVGASTYFSMIGNDSALVYTGYFALGYTLRNVKVSTTMMLPVLVGGLVGFLVTLYGTYDLTVSSSDKAFKDLFYLYNSPNVCLMALSVFLIAQKLFQPKLAGPRSVWFWRVLASCVPGIYLVHAMVLSLLARDMLWVKIPDTLWKSTEGIPVVSLTILMISFAFVLLIKQIPLLKIIVP